MSTEVRQFFNKMANEWDQREVKTSLWLTNFVNKYIPLQKGMRVLDLGCGTGIISHIIQGKTNTNVVALDVSENMIEIAKEKHISSNIDFYAENFYQTDHTGFDMIVCFNAYPHFTDVLSFNKKALEVLNEKGYLVVLHSLSREALSICHQGLSKTISRELHPIKEEVKFFEDNFNVLELIDNDEMVLMLLQKK